MKAFPQENNDRIAVDIVVVDIAPTARVGIVISIMQ